VGSILTGLAQESQYVCCAANVAWYLQQARQAVPTRMWCLIP
jgi:hypothetical protein